MCSAESWWGEEGWERPGAKLKIRGGRASERPRVYVCVSGCFRRFLRGGFSSCEEREREVGGLTGE